MAAEPFIECESVPFALLDLSDYDLQDILQEVVDCGMGGMGMQVCHRFQKVLRVNCRVTRLESRTLECVRWSGKKMWELLFRRCEEMEIPITSECPQPDSMDTQPDHDDLPELVAATPQDVPQCLPEDESRRLAIERGHIGCTEPPVYTHLDIPRYTTEYGYEYDCHMNERLELSSHGFGHLDCLKYAHQKESESYESSLSKVQRYQAMLAKYATVTHNLEFLTWLREHRSFGALAYLHMMKHGGCHL